MLHGVYVEVDDVVNATWSVRCSKSYMVCLLKWMVVSAILVYVEKGVVSAIWSVCRGGVVSFIFGVYPGGWCGVI